MSGRGRRAPRGQSLVETVLGLLVFVSILVWGIHFAQLGYLAPKVHEAAANALWDTTAKKMHNHPNGYGPMQAAIGAAGPETAGRFANFDGRSSKQGSGQTLSQLFTEARDLTVTCDRDPVADMSQKNYEAFTGNGGMSCYASAQLRVVNFPKSFVDQGSEGFFKVKNYPNLGWFTFCSMGLASGGDCSRGRFTMMLDDWGLSGGPESRDHLLHGGGNKAFAGLVENVYGQTGASGLSAGYAMAAGIVLMTPPGDRDGTFWMSYQSGKPDPTFIDGDNGPNDWMTNVRSGSRNSKYKDRGSRWLGL